MDVSQVNPADYDICYKFTPLATPDPTKEKPLEFTFSLQYEFKDDKGVQQFAQLLNNEKFKLTAKSGLLVDLCFSQLMDGYGTTEGKLTASVNVLSPDQVTFAKENSHLYSKLPSTSAPLGFNEKLTQYFSIPVGFLTLSSGALPADKKQKITVKPQVHHKDDKMSVYSQWITIPENMRTEPNNANLNTIALEDSASKLSMDTKLCKPRNDNDNGPNCVSYSGALGDDLNNLQATTKFQIVYTVTANDEMSATDVPNLISQVSLFDACKTQTVQCKSSGKCVTKGLSFQCENCTPLTAKGKYCEELTCDPDNKKVCDKQHSGCVQFEDQTFHCLCPTGYESDATKQV